MKVVRIEDIELRHLGDSNTPRGDAFDFQLLATGQPGEPDNFAFLIYYTDSNYETPRHRHNFDQIRFQIEGDEYDYSRDGKMGLGDVGYFPEGTYYGPAKSGDKVATVLLQIGGISGQGYMSQQEYTVALEALKNKGEFSDGIFTWFDKNGGKHNQDGYEAVWEQCRQQRLDYPPQRFQGPIFMASDAFAWLPYDDLAGVEHKVLGSFGEGGGMTVGFFRMQASSILPSVPERTLFFVLDGNGLANEEKWGARSGIHVDRGDTCSFKATQPSTLFYIGIPDHASIQQARPPMLKRPPRVAASAVDE